jgi:hypothetical protein
MRFRLFAAVVAAAGSAPVAAQQPTRSDSATIAVIVLDAATNKPVESAEVRVGGAASVLRTDFMGEATTRHPRQTTVRLTIRHLAYAPIDTSFALGDTDWQLMLAAHPAAPRLAPTTVTATPTAPRPHLMGFESRRAQNKGRYITPEELAKSPERKLVDMIVRMGGLVSDASAGGNYRLLARSGPTSFVGSGTGGSNMRGNNGVDNPGVKPGHCEVSVFVDGVFLPNVDMASMRAAGFDAVEYYTVSNVPPEFKRSGVTCGVLLLWSK